MRRKRHFYAYIMASLSGTLYTGFSNNIYARVLQHKDGETPGFTRRYGCNRLVHYETFDTAAGAIAREDQLKGWSRAKKIALVESENPKWQDLAEDWGKQVPATFKGRLLGKDPGSPPTGTTADRQRNRE